MPSYRAAACIETAWHTSWQCCIGFKCHANWPGLTRIHLATSSSTYRALWNGFQPISLMNSESILKSSSSWGHTSFHTLSLISGELTLSTTMLRQMIVCHTTNGLSVIRQVSYHWSISMWSRCCSTLTLSRLHRHGVPGWWWWRSMMAQWDSQSITAERMSWLRKTGSFAEDSHLFGRVEWVPLLQLTWFETRVLTDSHRQGGSR